MDLKAGHKVQSRTARLKGNLDEESAVSSRKYFILCLARTERKLAFDPVYDAS